ncbi:hypothetical protein ABT086_40095, partial [Streptomyces mirabilis]
MGRHGRSAVGRAATGRATGVTENHGPLTESYGPENLYGYAAVADLPPTAAARSHRKRKTATPVRTGLLGVHVGEEVHGVEHRVLVHAG